jgi:hypothetical protein
VRRHRDAEGQAGLVDGSWRRGRDPGLALVGVPAVPEHQAVADDPRLVTALLPERVLDLEQVGEVARGVDADVEADRLVLVIEYPELLVEAIGHLTLADDRERGVDVDRAATRHQEEPGLEVLQVVGRQGGQSLAVDCQDPLGQEPGVE